MFTSLSNYFRFLNVTNPKPDNFSTICRSCGLAANGTSLYVNHCGECYCHNCVPPSLIDNLYAFAMDELCSLLDKNGIPHNTPEHFADGRSLRFSWTEGDVVCHPYSYGGPFGCFETMGFTADNGDVSGWLRPSQALKIILHDWNEHNKKIKAEGE